MKQARKILAKYLPIFLILLALPLFLMILYCVGRPLFAIRGEYETIEDPFVEYDQTTGFSGYSAFPLCRPLKVGDEARNPFNGQELEVDEDIANGCCGDSSYTVYVDDSDNLFWVESDGGGDGVYGPFEYEKESLPGDKDESTESLSSGGESILVAFYGDSRSGHTTHQALADRMETLDLDAVFHTGDLVNTGDSDEDWAAFNSVTADLRASFPFYPAIGNHEGDGVRFTEEFDLPNNERWYSVVIDDGYFIILDTTSDISTSSAQYKWLQQELKKASSETDSVFAVFHHPAFNTGSHAEDEADLRTNVIPLFEQYGVDMTFAGHDHNYERSLNNGVYHIVAGGGGAPLYDKTRQASYSQKFLKQYHFCTLEISDDTAEMKVYSSQGTLLDSITVSTEDDIPQRSLF